MRALALSVSAVTVLAGCGQPAPQPPAPATSSAAAPAGIGTIDPERIRRLRPALPEGYEVADVGGYASSPVAFWGLGRGATAEPPQCAALVDPAPDGPAVGISGSGPGGIVYVVVVTGPPRPQAGLDSVLLGGCGQWSMAYGSSTADVTLTDAPMIDGAATLGAAATVRARVESGNETDSRADTFLALVDQYVVFVTLVTDPGAVGAPLPPQYASDLLVTTVNTLRG
ncbi:DUF5642 family protein [Mycolicibacterium tokaiense]|uniref:Putative secreted protein n=1 Tax=Mycolicibacterium tokaiense TaxID=39695 RepID=A0A378TCE3_9MYCO|nr:DUF5642 family protein [Mycolicibacterium tokaiense]BBY87054.1 hypothetical protein MTOK_28360 [Mycolicibacterium tokaiense]STZ58429.1 putative secreted protein [Mycolicibacterium tokaiense]